jgi:exopolyphosphatase / guanosine-5'-triphosphate,3'-diphosphate pyrophosphatase
LKYLRFASIDIGSNAIRLLFSNVFETENGPVFRKASLIRVPLRLGADSFTHQIITPENTNRLIDTMLAFKHLMKVHDIINYKAYATSAMRDAMNAQEVVKKVLDQSGISIEIISGEKEAEEIASKFLWHELVPDDRILYIDVGGGSAELTYFNGEEKVDQHSFNIGTIRMLHNTVTPNEWIELNDWLIKNELHHSKINIIGSGGNINKIFKMKRRKINDLHLTSRGLKEAYDEIVQLSYEDRIVKYFLNPDRADVILPASQIFLSIIKITGSKKIYVPKVGLSDGIVRSLYTDYKKGIVQPWSSN